MKFTLLTVLLSVFIFAAWVEGGRRPMKATTTEASTTTASDDDDDEVVTRVKGYIDAGTCNDVETEDVCDDESYYKEFTYNGKRVVIANGYPDHEAEEDMYESTPVDRCQRWTFMEVPLEPTKADALEESSMGVVGLAVTGGTFYNYLSAPDGSLALTNEGTTLDSCLGHSSSDNQYHYHANINCSLGSAAGANDADSCVQLGYWADGVPVYGFCKDSSGAQMTSCYALDDGATTTTIETVSGTYTTAYYSSDYSYDEDAFDNGECNLDVASGAVHPTTGQYSYFLTIGYPWVPIFYAGSDGPSDLCSAA